MKKNFLLVSLILMVVLLMPAEVVHATQTINDTLLINRTAGNAWLSLTNTSNGSGYLLHDSGDSNNLEFVARDINGGTTWQALNLNRWGNVSVGSNLSESKFQVNANYQGWAAKFVNTGIDARFGYGGGTGFFIRNTAGGNPYELRIYNGGTNPTFEIMADGRTSIDNTLKTKQVIVTSNVWADYVFDGNYKLRPLSEVESYINLNKHLPEIPSSNEVVSNGLSLGDMQQKQMAKIEELTLYSIQLDKENKNLKSEVDQMSKELAQIKEMLKI